MFGCHLYISVDVGINGTLATMGMLSVRWSCWFMLLNCAQYNGKYGCTTCKHKGQEVRIFTHAYIHIMWCTGCACWITFQVKVGRGTARAYGFEQLVLRESATHLTEALTAESSRKVWVIIHLVGIHLLLIHSAFNMHAGCVWCQGKVSASWSATLRCHSKFPCRLHALCAARGCTPSPFNMVWLHKYHCPWWIPEILVKQCV